MHVAATALAAPRHHNALARRGEIGEQGLVVVLEHLRAGRDLDHHVFPAPPYRPLPMRRRLHAVKCCRSEVEESVLVVDGFEDDAAAVAPVAAVGPTLGDVFFASRNETQPFPPSPERI